MGREGGKGGKEGQLVSAELRGERTGERESGNSPCWG